MNGQLDNLSQRSSSITCAFFGKTGRENSRLEILNFDGHPGLGGLVENKSGVVVEFFTSNERFQRLGCELTCRSNS